MNNRQNISAPQNKWHDSQSVDDADLNLEQEYNNQVQTGIINNHFGSGLLPNTLNQKVLFDSSLVTGLLDGKAINPQEDPSDNTFGSQLEVELVDSKVAGRRKVKVAIIGLDFENNLQYDTFVFSKNEKQITSKHYLKILKIYTNDFIGSTGQSLNLGGKLYIREAKPLSLSRDAIMIAQDVQPNLFWRDFFVSGTPSLSSLLTNSLSGYNIDTLGISTGYKQLRSLNASDVSSQIGQKFLAKTNNIQKVTILLSATSGSPWTGDLVVSIYPLQSTIQCPGDTAPGLAIDFSPSNVPIAQMSVNYTTLLEKGIELNSVPQPVDFVFSNTPVANGSAITVGNYYAITIRRSGTADTGVINTPVGNNVVEDSMLTLFNGDTWVDVPEEDMWFQVWTDAAKVSDGQAYDNGHGITVPKTKLNTSSGVEEDYCIDKLSFLRNTQYYGFLQAATEESNLIQDERTGNPVFSRKQYVPEISLVTTSKLLELQETFDPILIGSIYDKNKKSVDSGSSLTLTFGIHNFTFVKNELYIKIIDDISDPSYDAYVPSLVSKFLDGSLNKAKFIPNINKSSLYYKVASSELISMIYGDINGDGIVDENDLIQIQSLEGYDLTTAPADDVEYLSKTELFVNDSGLTFQIKDLLGSTIASDIDGEIIPDPYDDSKCNFSSASVNFSSITNLTSKIITITSTNSGNNGVFKIVGIVDSNNIILQKQLITGDIVLKLLRADINGDAKITSSDTTLLSSYVFKENPFPSTTSPANKIGTRFNVLKIELESFIERDDDYSTASSIDRGTTLHPIQDIFLNDVSVIGSGFAGTNLIASPISASTTSVLSWDESNIAITTDIKSVTCTFTEKDSVIIDPQDDGVKITSFPIAPSFDSGMNNLFIPNNLIIGKGEIKRPDGYYYKVDFEIGNIVIEIPAVSFPEEKSVNIFTDFVCNYTGTGYTRLGLPAMRFADGYAVGTDAMSLGQLRFLTSVQSFSPSLDGYDFDLSGAIIDGRIGVYMDTSSGILTLNFSNLYEDAVLQTLSTKIQVTVLMKRAGFNNNPIFFDSTKTKNLLDLTGLPSVGGSGTSVFAAAPEEIPIVTAPQTSSSSSFADVGAVYFDPNSYPDEGRSIKLRVVAVNNTVSETTEIAITDAAGSVIDIITTNNNTFTSDLSIELNSLLTTAQVYRIQLRLASGSGNTTLYNATLELNWS